MGNIMNFNKILLGAILVAGNVFVRPAFAADIAPDSSCSLNGLIEGSGIYNQTSFPNALPGAAPNQTYISAFGLGAVDYNCGFWNYQAIVQATNYFPSQYDSGGRGYTYAELSATAEADIFWRDPQSYAIGFGLTGHGSDDHLTGFGTFSGQDFHNTNQYLEGLVFAEAYLNDQMTLGAGGFLNEGNRHNGLSGADRSYQTFGGDLYARFYATPNLRFTLRGSLSQNTTQVTNNVITSYGAAAIATYKIANTPIALFTRANFGGSNETLASPFYPSSYAEGVVGFTVALGPHAYGSLLEEDRNGVMIH